MTTRTYYGFMIGRSSVSPFSGTTRKMHMYLTGMLDGLTAYTTD
jgi:hypothetical protein